MTTCLCCLARIIAAFNSLRRIATCKKEPLNRKEIPHLFLVFVRMFEQAEQHSFVPPIMIIEHNFTCSNKKTNMDKNYIQRNSWTFGSPACQKIWEKKFSYLFIAPPKRKHCWTAPDPPLWACWGDVTMPPLLLWLSAHHSANAHDAITLVCVDTARCRGTLWLK